MVKSEFIFWIMIATVEKNREDIGNAKGIEIIISGLDQHQQHSGVQESACTALFNLMVKNGTNKVCFATYRHLVREEQIRDGRTRRNKQNNKGNEDPSNYSRSSRRR